MKHLIVISVFVFLFHATPSQAAGGVKKTITVNQQGHGDFKTVQEAIDSVPDGNTAWTRILIGIGVYREKVNLPKTKGYLLIEGAGLDLTSIEWGDAGSLSHRLTTSTFTSSASNVVFRRLSFKNTYMDTLSGTKQAIAMLVEGDKTSFYECGFFSFQDTLCDLSGRHYFRYCYIQGSIDFIFGWGQSIYERCNIVAVPNIYGPGWITANGRLAANDSTGFVFMFCNLIGSGTIHLGRAWSNFSRVIFYKSFMSNVIVPRGWDSWNTPDKGASTFYVESNCFGVGSDTSGRVRWTKHPPVKELKQMTSISFVDSEGWLRQQP